MLRLTDSNTRALLAQPESGMGYQVVEATLSNNETKRGVAYNAELLLFEEEPRRIMLSTPYLRLLESAKCDRRNQIAPRHPACDRHYTFGTGAFRRSSSEEGGTAKDGPKEKTKAAEVFKRYAYQTRTTLD